MQDWNIKSRGEICSVTQRRFTDGELFYSALYWHNGVYERRDFCEGAWNERNDNIQPLCSWQSVFTPPEKMPETLKKEDAESLLRRLIEENDPAQQNARYILVLMLERKRLVRQIDRQMVEGGSKLIYEHLASGESWIIDDPGLKLAELEPVQREVGALLAGGQIEAEKTIQPEQPASTAV
jgi:hypothetical protein